MEGSSSANTHKRLTPKFTDLVLSWSRKEIFDDNLYKNQVEKIPESFESVDQYLGSYVFPLLEETRTELSSAMETLCKAPFAEITSLLETKLSNFRYNVKVDHWRNIIRDCGREPYRTMHGDLFLLSDLRPQSDSDIKRGCSIFTLACVRNISVDESDNSCTSADLILKTVEQIKVTDGHRKSLYLVYLMNLTSQRRNWNTLHMRRNLTIIKKVLTKNDLGMESCDSCPIKSDAEFVKKFGSTLLSKLNESQHEAVLASLSKIGCTHKSSVQLIWGPPGTGKTKTLSSLLFILLTQNVRTIICAPTILAIKEIASEVIELVRNSVETESKKNKSFLPCSLADMLIYENKGHRKVGSDFEEIFLDERVECLGLRSLQDYPDKFGLPTGRNRSSVTALCFQQASLIFCTISSLYKLHSVDTEPPFNVLVIPDAAKVKECESIVSIQIPGLSHVILVGDEKQLRATVCSKLSEGAGFGRSLFERLSSIGHSKCLLNVQYRMHPSISQFPNSKFYQTQILDAACVKNQIYDRRYLQGRMFGPYSFINIHGGKEEWDDFGQSKINMVEVAVIVTLVRKLFKAWSGSNENLNIGVISPYASQVAAIQDKLQQKYENLERFIVKVKSVNEFQDKETDIIILSTVRSDSCGSIGFLPTPQTTNFALTRARHCLWLLGNEKALSLGDPVWEALICDAKHRQCFFTADGDCDIQKTIVNVKKELEELDDLRSGESVLFKNSRWKVLFSDCFLKKFPILKSLNVKKLVIGTLLKLASGWRPKNTNVELKCNKSYTVEHFKVGKYYIVCSIDITKEFNYEQVLKVWDILPMAETLELVRKIESISRMYTDYYIQHCNKKLLEGKLVVPISWSPSSGIVQFKNLKRTNIDGAGDGRRHDENSKVNESLLLMKFYSLSTDTANYLLTDLEGRELDLPFEVTCEERDIIMFPRSSFILGRSGTGKTTILTMKLFRKFQQYHFVSHDSMVSDESRGAVLRQLFVTVSPKLCYAIRKHISQLKSFASGNFFGNSNFIDLDDVDDMAEFKDIPDTFVGIQPEKYPLIITFHKFLMMLDGTLGNSYFDRLRGGVGGSSRDVSRRLVALNAFIRNNEVTFDRFRSFYWPRFNVKLTKNLDPSRVFTEIISHIKGGPPKGKTCDRVQSRPNYVSLCHRRVSTLIAEQREVIYDIFEDYEKMKSELREFDLADFVADIHLRLNQVDPLGDIMDFVYIDEVQDLTLRQISLFRYICKNVDEGFVFSGDTAQTIARGIDFRFEDVRSLFYEELCMKSGNYEHSGRRGKGLISDNFCLSQNFRTHTGVLRLAQSVVDLIDHFFPQSIDSLAPETSLVYGESPLVLEPGSDENLIVTIFGHRANAGRKWVGFGADQVILVRDDSIREEIFKSIGHQALVLTIVECKGLEFQDVLLYNFFGSSPLSSQWRLLYEFSKEVDFLDASSRRESFPSFSQSKHNILCSELKQLYVAITRTRQRLWICENNEELSKPMLDYWRRLSLVKVRKMDDSLAQEMQRESSPEEWKSQGIKLFWQHNYEMAIMCFEKAGEEEWGKRAKASGLRSDSVFLRGSNPKGVCVMLREAAEIFDSINRPESAAECFYDLGDYERAGRIYMEKCGTSELRKAGECFSLAGRHKTAAEVYAKGYLFKECLSACTEGKYFDLGLHYIERHQSSWNSEVDKIAQKFLEKCPVECFKSKDSASIMKLVRAFRTMISKRNFFKSLDRLDWLLNLEEDSGNFNEAADIAGRLGDVLREVDLLEKGKQFEKASLLLLSYVLSNSLWVSGTQGWPLKSFPRKDELLLKAKSAALKVSGTFHASVCAEAEILSHEKINLSGIIKLYSASKRYKTHMGEIISVRKLLEAHFEANPDKYEWDPPVLRVDPSLCDERMSRHQVSVETLFYVWNLWKTQSSEILECLDSVERVDLVTCKDSVARFCLGYFGVRFRHDPHVSYLLLKPDAAWIGNAVAKKFVLRKRNTATLDARHFGSAARTYWCQELIAAGFKVLDVLEALYEHSVVKHFSTYCQGLCLTYIFDVTNFFLESKSIDVKKVDVRRLQGFLQLSTKYFDIVFPLDRRDSLSHNIVSLRETELSKNLLEDIISRHIGNELTYGLIGRVVVTILGSESDSLKIDLYSRTRGRFYKNSSWMSFIQSLTRISKSDSEHVALSHKFHRALAETYNNADWRAITPHCYFYLVERLLILVPHSRGYFFTTKSAFVEYLISLRSDANVSAGFLTDEKSYPTGIFDFAVSVVQRSLFRIRDTREWIDVSGIDCEYYFPVLVLRLVVILLLLCLDSGLSFNVILKLLDVPEIRSQLPREFCEALLQRKRESDSSYLAVVADALEVIGDRLVIVSISETCPNLPCPDAVFIDLRSLSDRNGIMKMLFLVNSNNAIESCEIEAPSVVSDEGNSVFTRSSNMTCGTSENRSFQVNWGLIGKISDSVKSLGNRNEGNLLSFVLKEKEEVQEYMKLLTDVMAQLHEQRYLIGEDKDELSEVTSMIEELNRFFSSIEMSVFDFKAVSEIGQVLKNLESRRSRLDRLLSMFSIRNYPINGSVVVTPMVDPEQNSSESCTEIEEPAQCSQGKGHSNNNKPKKGKKGGRRRK